MKIFFMSCVEIKFGGAEQLAAGAYKELRLIVWGLYIRFYVFCR